MKSIRTMLVCLFWVLGCSNVMALDTKQKESLVAAAVSAAVQSYSPYSHYPVGAALLTDDGKVVSGTNVENASFGLTNCAERSAVFSAVSQGNKVFRAIAIVTKDGGMPCGACRQVLNEFNPDIEIIIANLNGQIQQTTTLASLLPDSFGPKNL